MIIFFSIVNHKILSNKLINHVRKLTVNYHDALLPNYAGVHATCWAILNDEKRHGITWHVVNELVDGGDILKQVDFLLERNETALSLHLKCHQYAISSFKLLVNELSTNTYCLTQQNFKNRSYYSINKKPFGNG